MSPVRPAMPMPPVTLPRAPRDGRPALVGAVPAVAILLAWTSPASAQLSPGPLSRAHQFLSGPTQCTACHEVAGGPGSFVCLSCHVEIEKRLASHKGLHATFRMPTGSSRDCVACHSEHNGEDFQLVHWDAARFDHAGAGYPLRGRHVGVPCARCHRAENVAAEARREIKVRDLARTFLGLEVACGSCHRDPHQGRLGARCETCHREDGWKAVELANVDHGRTRYALTGLHARVGCPKCHLPGPDGAPRYLGIAHDDCRSCHVDPHGGAFVKRCDSCHVTEGWRLVRAPAMRETFDHARTRYPLLGRHASVPCGRCHAGGDFKAPLVFDRCSACHRPDPHGGQLAARAGGGECSSCHTVSSFSPSTFTVADHASTGYPLEGRHASVPCARCHTRDAGGTRFRLAHARCNDCHADAHQGQLAGPPHDGRCEACHTVEGFSPSTFTLARHEGTRFPLTGGHLPVPCADCHRKEVDGPSAATYRWEALACATCHPDPHRAQFARPGSRLGVAATSCDGCHGTSSWKEAPRFDHAATAFPLLGAHRVTPCSGCHRPPNLEVSTRNVDYLEAPTACEDCHADVHGGQFAKEGVTSCAGCHDAARWKPARFDHDHTAFPLDGRHRNVACDRCHKLQRPVGGRDVLFYRPTPRECAACHGPAT